MGKNGQKIFRKEEVRGNRKKSQKFTLGESESVDGGMEGERTGTKGAFVSSVEFVREKGFLRNRKIF